MQMKHWMSTKKSNLTFVLFSFLVWRVGVLIFAYLAVRFVPLFSHNYLGDGFSNYLTNPVFWGHLNFDGEHYLAIAQNGYRPLEYFFFPLFPQIVKLFSSNNSQMTLAWTGLVVSNLSFVAGLVGIYKLVKLDYKEKVARVVVILFLIFPTSFYFGAYYTESLFLGLIVWAFYYGRKGNFWIASIIAAMASATRLVGAAMFPVLLLELILQRKKNFLPVLLSPVGLVTYMYYLMKQTGDSLIFLHQVSIFGEQRSSTLISLPQVFYRYIFKILPVLNYSYFPVVFTTFLEFGLAILFLVFIIFGLFKLRLSYTLYAVIAFIVPTLAGSFSSMPRYVLAIFPVFILSSIYFVKLPKIYKVLVFSVMLILMVISVGLFWRGYWLS